MSSPQAAPSTATVSLPISLPQIDFPIEVAPVSEKFQAHFNATEPVPALGISYKRGSFIIDPRSIKEPPGLSTAQRLAVGLAVVFNETNSEKYLGEGEQVSAECKRAGKDCVLSLTVNGQSGSFILTQDKNTFTPVVEFLNNKFAAPVSIDQPAAATLREFVPPNLAAAASAAEAAVVPRSPTPLRLAVSAETPANNLASGNGAGVVNGNAHATAPAPEIKVTIPNLRPPAPPLVVATPAPAALAANTPVKNKETVPLPTMAPAAAQTDPLEDPQSGLAVKSASGKVRAILRDGDKIHVFLQLPALIAGIENKFNYIDTLALPDFKAQWGAAGLTSADYLQVDVAKLPPVPTASAS